MTDKRLFVLIEVENKATQVFREIGQSAKQAATDMVNSGERAKQGIERIDKAADAAEDTVKELEAAQKKAAQSADQLAKQSETAGRSLRNYDGAVRDAVSGMALLGTAFTMYAGQARDHEIAVMSLERTYGEAAASFISFANEMQDTTIFSNDQVLAAANVMGTLQRNYGLTTDQIKQLIAVSGDLAALNGITLTDAAQRVAAAIRGEAESAELLGLTMNQASIDADGLTLSMSNTEAGTFRFNALMGQSAFALGAASDAANTTTGQVQQLANEAQDAALAFVEFTGPIGDVAAGLGAFGLEAGIAVGGLAQLAKGINGLRSVGSLTALAASLAGPAGVAVAAGVAGYALWQLFSDTEKAGVVAFERATAATGDLTESIDVLIGRLSDARVQLNLLGDSESFSGLTGEIERQLELFQKWGDPSFWQNGTPLNWIDTGNPADLAAARAEWEELIALNARLGDSTQQMAEQVASSYNEIINNTGPGADAALQTAMNWVDAWQAGEITLVELNDRLNGVIADLKNYDEAALQAAAATQEAAAAAQIYATRVNDMTVAQIAANAEFRQWLELHGLAQQYDQERATDPRIGSENQVNWLAKYADIIDIAQVRTEGAIRSTSEWAKAISAVVEQAPDLSLLWSGAEPQAADVLDVGPWLLRYGAMGKAAADFAELVEAGAIDAVDATKYMKWGIEDGLVVLEERYREAAEAVRESMDAMNPSSVLSGTLNGVVGAAQGFARLSESVWDWSNSLTEGNKATSTLNKLHRDGLISDKTYRDGLEANHRIMLANNSVQEDSLRIQAKQLPLMAQLAEAHARYVDEIADMDTEQQMVALGFMDTAKQAQAMQIAQLAAASSTSAMQASTTELIEAVAEADPQLRAMLVSMGLISETDTGITVHYGDVDEGKRALDALNSTLMGFALLISEAFGIEINLNDNDSLARLLQMEATLSRLDGRSVTTYVTTFDIGGGSLVNAGRAATGATILHRDLTPVPIETGIVRRMASGGAVTTLVGENGPELARFPPGTQVTNAAGTRGRLSPMGRGRRDRSGDVFKGNNITMIVTTEDNALTRRAAGMAQRRGRR